MSLVSRLKARLGLDTVDFERGVDRAKREGQGLGNYLSQQLTSRLKGGLAGIVGGLGITSALVAMRDLTRSVADIGTLARRAGLDTTAFQQLSFVARQNRVDVDALVDGFKELNLRADEFVVTGSGSAADAFKRLGYTARDLARGLEKPDALFLDIIERLEDLDQAAQIRVLDEVFGGAGGEQFIEMINGGADGIRAAMTNATELGLVLDEEMIAKAEVIDRKWDALTQRVLTFFKTVAVDGAAAISALAEETTANIEMAATVRLQIADEQAQADLRNRANALLADPAAVAAIGKEADYLRLASRIEAERLISAEGIASAYRQIAGETANLAILTRRAADDAAYWADTTTDADIAVRLGQIADELEAADAAFTAGTLSGEAFNTKLTALTTEAEAALTALAHIDDVDFDDVRGRLGDLITRLGETMRAALAAASAMPSAQAVAERHGRGEERLGQIGLPPVMQAPPSPPSRPDDIDFAVITPPAGGGGGGGGKGAAPTSQYLEGLADLRAEIAALQLETEEVTGVIGSALPYALERARKASELLAAAQAEGRDLTPALRTEVEKLADAYAKAGHEAEIAAERLAKVQENGERGAQALSDVFMAAVNGAGNAKQAVASLLAQLAQSYALKGIMGFGASGLPGSGMVAGLGALLGGNANGTTNWRGGLTAVHERGGEIMDLPDGTRIFPNDISKRMVDNAGKAAGGGAHMSIGFDASIGSLTATMHDIAGNVVARESGAIANTAVGMVQRGTRKTSRFLGA